MGSISLKGIKFFFNHGFYPEEKLLKGNFSVDITIGFPTERVTDDNLNDTVNYEDIYEIVHKRMHIHAKLIETLGNDICIQVKKLNDDIEYVEVIIHKHFPPLNGEVRESVVCVKR